MFWKLILTVKSSSTTGGQQRVVALWPFLRESALKKKKKHEVNQTLTVIVLRWCLRWVKKVKRKDIQSQHIVLYCAIGGPFYLSQSDIYNVNGFPLKKYSIQVQLKKWIYDGTVPKIFDWLLKTSKYAQKQRYSQIDGTRSIDIALRTEHKDLLVQG